MELLLLLLLAAAAVCRDRCVSIYAVCVRRNAVASETSPDCYKLYERYSQANTHKYYFTNRICDIWNALPSSVDCFQTTAGPW